jgi:ABC-type cobalamin transport system ATPase subunit
MTIQSVEIQNVKGIQDKTLFPLNLEANKITFVVAPNGFGKSSFFTAFKSLKPRSLSVEPKDKSLLGSDSSLEITIEGNSYKADSNKNEIMKAIGILAINSSLVATAPGRRTEYAQKPYNKVETIELIKIPERKEFKTYSNYATITGRGAPDFRKDYLDNYEFIIKLTGFPTKYCDTLKTAIEQNNDNAIVNITQYKFLQNITANNDDSIKIIKFLAGMSEGELKKYIKYAQYSIFKARIKAILENLRTSDHQRAPRKDNKNNALILEFPRADKLSNGQRDVIQLVAHLEKAKLELDKSKNLLIIDELFDYLDDANLLIVQYFLSRLVKDFEKQDKDLYVVLLTHLDPSYFKSYNLKEFNISALNSQDFSSFKQLDEYFVKLLIHRKENNKEYKDALESNFLHYHHSSEDISREKVPNGLSHQNPLLSFSEFSKHLNKEFNNYINGEPYCCYSVSCYIRIEIEKRTYLKLEDESLKENFLKTHKTLKKLELYKEKGKEVPELYFLLGIIHNEALHINEKTKEQKSFMIYSKLQNAIIKGWLKDTFSEEVGTLSGNALSPTQKR